MTGEAGRSARGWHQRLSNPCLPLWRESCTHLLSHVEGTGGTPPEGHVGAGAGVCSRGSFVRSCQGQRDQGVGWLCAVRLGQRKSQSRWSRNKAERAEGRQADTGRQQREREISEKKRSPGSRHVTKEGRRASSLREWSRSQGPWGHQAA